AYYAGFNFDFQVNAGPDIDIWSGEEVMLYGTGAGDGGSYEWDGDIMDSVAFIPDETMTYTVVGWNVEGCEDDDEVLVTVFEIPTSDAGSYQDICDTSATNLMGNEPLPTGLGEWTLAAGPSIPFIDDINDPETEITG